VDRAAGTAFLSAGVTANGTSNTHHQITWSVFVTTRNGPLDDGGKCPRKVAGGGKCYKHR
jgi:hypothetical protein